MSDRGGVYWVAAKGVQRHLWRRRKELSPRMRPRQTYCFLDHRKLGLSRPLELRNKLEIRDVGKCDASLQVPRKSCSHARQSSIHVSQLQRSAKSQFSM